MPGPDWRLIHISNPQCELPASLPDLAVVAVTYNSSYMANMKTANIQ